MGSPTSQARVLVATGEQVLARSLETILAPAGFAVWQAFSGQSALELAKQEPFDAFILDLQPPDISGMSVCRTLRADPHITPATPIILITATAATRQVRLDALRAGASDLRSGPLDVEEFVLDLEARLRAKFDVDLARSEGLTDSVTGVYNSRGLERRAHEVAASAARRHAVYACAAFTPDAATASPTDLMDLGDRLARAFYSQSRTSDALARVGPVEFVVIAPETDAAGAGRLAERLARAVEGALGGNGGRVRLRSGHYALPEPPAASLDPLMPVARARAALGTIRAT